MIYCPYCNDDREGLRFALTRDDLLLMFNEEELAARKEYLIDPVIFGEDGTLKKYGIDAAADDCLRVLFRHGEIPDILRDRIRMEPASSGSHGHVSVDGYTAEIISKGGKPTPLTTVACGNCHLILPNEYADNNGVSAAAKSVNISLISNVGGSKTALAISLYYRFKEKGNTINMAEPFFNNYYKGLEALLAKRTAPGATHGSKTPCLTIKFRNSKREITDIHITDTAGEILGKEPERKDIVGEVRDFRPAIESDMLIVIVDSDDKSRISLTRLESYMEALKVRLAGKTRPTKIIICFSKCDRYPEHAAEYMITDFDGWKEEWKKKGLDYENLINLRKYRMSQDSSFFMTGEFYEKEPPKPSAVDYIEEFADGSEEPGFDIDIDIPVEEEKTVQPVSEETAEPEGGNAAPETPEETGSAAAAEEIDTVHYLRSLRVCCNEISDYTVKYACVAPFGTDVADSKLAKRYAPMYIEDLIETIKVYGGIR